MYLQGQSKLADQLKKSYSLNDLNTNDDDRRFTPNSQAIEEEDDETGGENEFKHEVTGWEVQSVITSKLWL